MSNRIHIQRTKFCNLHVEKRKDSRLFDVKESDMSRTFGFRAFDDYSQMYDNSLNGHEIAYADDRFLRHVYDIGDDTFGELIDYALEHGLYIDDNWYDAEWVKKALKV